MSTFEIKDKVALVTGSNRGIGEAFVLGLVNAGAKKVYATTRDLKNLNMLVDKYPEVVEPVLLDVTNSDHIKSLPEKVTELDLLINNAGIVNASNLTSENSLEIVRQEMETNFFGLLHITQTLLPLIKQSDQGAIVNISSIAGISNFPAIATYSTSKAAVHSYIQGLRAELADTNIQVVGVYPGPIDTRMSEGFDMPKPMPSQVVEKVFDALLKGEKDVMPDEFSQQMYAMFLEHPDKLEQFFAEM